MILWKLWIAVPMRLWWQKMFNDIIGNCTNARHCENISQYFCWELWKSWDMLETLSYWAIRVAKEVLTLRTVGNALMWAIGRWRGSSSRYHLKTTTRNLLTSQNHHSTILKLKQGKLPEYKMFGVLKALEGTIHPIEIQAAHVHNSPCW